MKYELTFNLLLVRLKGRECNRHLAFWTKAELTFPNSESSWCSEATQTRESSMLPLTGVQVSQMELLNVAVSVEFSSYHKAHTWQINKTSEHKD